MKGMEQKKKRTLQAWVMVSLSINSLTLINVNVFRL